MSTHLAVPWTQHKHMHCTADSVILLCEHHMCHSRESHRTFMYTPPTRLRPNAGAFPPPVRSCASVLRLRHPGLPARTHAPLCPAACFRHTRLPAVPRSLSDRPRRPRSVAAERQRCRGPRATCAGLSQPRPVPAAGFLTGIARLQAEGRRTRTPRRSARSSRPSASSNRSQSTSSRRSRASPAPAQHTSTSSSRA